MTLSQGFTQGPHYLKVRAGDIENYVADIAQIPVIFDCNDDRDRPGWGDIYTPAHMERTAGVVEVTGFAIDQDGNIMRNPSAGVSMEYLHEAGEGARQEIDRLDSLDPVDDPPASGSRDDRSHATSSTVSRTSMRRRSCTDHPLRRQDRPGVYRRYSSSAIRTTSSSSASPTPATGCSTL